MWWCESRQRCSGYDKPHRRKCAEYKGHKGDHNFGARALKRMQGYVHD